MGSFSLGPRGSLLSIVRWIRDRGYQLWRLGEVTAHFDGGAIPWGAVKAVCGPQCAVRFGENTIVKVKSICCSFQRD